MGSASVLGGEGCGDVDRERVLDRGRRVGVEERLDRDDEEEILNIFLN